MSQNTQSPDLDTDSPAAVKEPRLWQDDGWTAKVVKNEDDDGWAVEMYKDGEREPANANDNCNPRTLTRTRTRPRAARCLPGDQARSRVAGRRSTEGGHPRNRPGAFVPSYLQSSASRQGRSLRMARQETESAIQPLMGFLRDNLARDVPPHEHVIVFDEAQRAWDAAYARRKFDLAESEAALFLDILDRHRDWAAIIALVGNGQEINTGEAGLAAWGEALVARPHWQVHAPPAVLTATDPRQRLFDAAPPQLTADPVLHLNVPVRSIRSAAASPWVDAVLLGDAALAASIAATAGGVPFLLTRSLREMRAFLRGIARGSRRAGLVCSAGAKRLRADGVWPNFPHMDANAVASWFLESWPDVRASDALELPATQFACQGLELDHVGLCWGNDLIRRPGQVNWRVRSFIGTRWQEPRGEAAIAFQINTYRVLLTRARYETVIWVPAGDEQDITRQPAEFDAIADFLLCCGVQMLDLATISTAR